MFGEHPDQPLLRFGRPRKDHQPARIAVEPMHRANRQPLVAL
jgi:hypothetical protein